jgi:hypothetical protein
VSFLFKALVQMGLTPVIEPSFPQEIIKSDILPLLHPFKIRRNFFSANRIYTFIVSVEHIEEMYAKSELEEQKGDTVWHQVATTLAPQRKLKDDIKNVP